MNATLDSDAPRYPPPAPPQQPLPPPPPPQQPLPPPPPPQQPLPPPPPPPHPPVPAPPTARFDGGGPTVSQVLVGVGALLVVVAVGVFSAVTWSALGPGGQALVLIGATAGAGGATVLLARRGLRASAEAVGVVSAALALATFEGARDVLFTGVDPWLAWAFGCGVVALPLIGLGHVARVRAPMIVAVILGQWCVPLVLAGSTPALLVVALAALWVAVADVLVATATTTRQPEVSALAGAFGVVAWLTSVLVGTALLFDRPGQAIIPLLLAALAAAAVAVSSHPAFRRWWVVAAAGATASTVLALIGGALALGAGDAFWLPVAVIAGGVAVWLPTRSDERLVAVTAVAGGSAVLVASAELARSLAAAGGPFLADAWVRLGWSATGRDVVALVESSGFTGEGDPTLTFVGLVAATGLLVRWPRVAFGAGAVTIAAAGGLLDLSVVAIVVVEVVLAVGLCLGYALDRRVPGEVGLIGLGLAFLAAGWALVVAPELVLGALIVMLAAAVAAMGAAIEGSFVPAGRRERVLVAGVGAAWLTGVGSALAFGTVMGWETATVWLFTAAAATAGSLVGFALDDRSASAAMLSDSCAVAGITVAGMIAATFGDAHTLSLVLAGVTVTGIAHTLRPDRFWPAATIGVVAWLPSVLVGTALLFDRPGQAIIPLLLAALAAAAVAVSSHPAFRRWWVVAAGGATASTVLALIGTALALGAGDAFWLPVAIIAGGVAVWLPTRSDDRLVAVAAVAGASAVLVAAAELARSIAAAAGPYSSDSWVRLGWSATGGDVVAPAETSWFMSEGNLTLTFLGLVAATGLLVRWPRVAVAAGALTVAAAGGLLDLSVAAVVVVEVSLAVGFCLGFALERRIPGEAGLIGLFFGVLATGWAHVVAPELVLGVLIVMLAAAVAAVVAAVEGSTVAASRRESVLIGGVGAAWLTGLGSALSFGVVMGWAPTTVWLFTAVAAMVGSLAGFVLDDRSAVAVVLSDFSAVAGIAVAGVAAAAFGDAHTLSLLLAGVTVTALAHTLRPDRFWPAAIIATGAGVSLVWLRLWMVDIEVVEAYSLPLAAGVGLLAWIVHRRGHPGGSWAITGPALLLATLPSTLLALGSPGGARSLLVIAVAVVMIVVGATLQWKAPLVLGAAIATVVGLAELWPAINRLPRWSVLATLGLTLIVLGARIEEGKKGVARLAGRLNSMW